MNNIDTMSYTELLEYIKLCNAEYRLGEPIVTDTEYDTVLIAKLKELNPNEPYLHKVEGELVDGKTVKLPEIMLSTDKVYSLEETTTWTRRIEQACKSLGIDIRTVQFKLTPKLDGYAIYRKGSKAYSRGDGTNGTDLSRIIDRGVVTINDTDGPSELVIDPDYFERELSEHYVNTRNIQGSVVKSGELSPIIAKAIKDKAVVVYPFSELPYKLVSVNELLNQYDDLIAEVKTYVQYDIDGVVVELVDPALKELLGHTNSYHRWQVAIKDLTEVKRTTVTTVQPQVSRTRRVNPVAILEPVTVSNSLISKVTVHHYGMVKEKGIGPGAIVDITRAGLVIPKIVNVHKSVTPEIPTRCPSCNSDLVWNADFLYCTNEVDCEAQKVRTMEYFFDTIKIVDGFGYKTLEILYRAGVTRVIDVYYLSYTDLREIGFGEQTAKNLILELERSKTYGIPDWLFLKSFGSHLMSGSTSEKLLSTYPLEEIFNLTEEQLLAIDGFGEVTAHAYVVGLSEIKVSFWKLLGLGFNITPTSRAKLDPSSVLYNKNIVFTGTLTSKTRTELQDEAKSLGAKVSKTVTGKTDILVVGTKVGASKMKAAAKHNVKTLTEVEYNNLISEITT